jgi:hypothetical protein
VWLAEAFLFCESTRKGIGNEWLSPLSIHFPPRTSMINFEIDGNGELKVGQQDFLPSVYLDHWALRRLSEDTTLANRLISALKSNNGTLAISVLNLIEFSKVKDAQQARMAENLIEAILPQVFFLSFNPFDVIEMEDALIAGGHPIPPHGDFDFLEAFAHLKPKSLNSFTSENLFVAVQKSSLSTSLDSLADTIIERVEFLRHSLDVDDYFRSAVKRLPGSSNIQRGTRTIVRELIRSLLVDRNTKITRNHAIDLLHAVVPVAYCDIVLLDKHWETQVDRARSRLEQARISSPIAKVFSMKNDGINRFLYELESGWPQ